MLAVLVQEVAWPKSGTSACATIRRFVVSLEILPEFVDIPMSRLPSLANFNRGSAVSEFLECAGASDVDAHLPGLSFSEIPEGY